MSQEVNFTSSMVQTYISAVLGSVVSQTVIRGVNGAPDRLDFIASFLIAGQVGTTFIAYPVAVRILKSQSTAFKNLAEDPNACQAQVWVKGGMLGAGIVTAVNYPLGLAFAAYWPNEESHPSSSVKEAAGAYLDQIGRSIGFAAVSSTLHKSLPATSNSLGSWVKNHAVVNLATLAGRLLAFPVLSVRHETTLGSIFAEGIQRLPGMVVTRDAMNQFKGIFGFLVQ
jgi:hypothetical protein